MQFSVQQDWVLTNRQQDLLFVGQVAAHKLLASQRNRLESLTGEVVPVFYATGRVCLLSLQVFQLFLKLFAFVLERRVVYKTARGHVEQSIELLLSIGNRVGLAKLHVAAVFDFLFGQLAQGAHSPVEKLRYQFVAVQKLHDLRVQVIFGYIFALLAATSALTSTVIVRIQVRQTVFASSLLALGGYHAAAVAAVYEATQGELLAAYKTWAAVLTKQCLHLVVLFVGNHGRKIGFIEGLGVVRVWHETRVAHISEHAVQRGTG